MIDEKKFIEYIDAGHYRSAYEKVFSENDVVNMIKKQPKVGGWIPVSKRLPKICKHEWIYVDCCRMSDTIYYDVKCEKCKKEKSIVIKRVQDEEI